MNTTTPPTVPINPLAGDGLGTFEVTGSRGQKIDGIVGKLVAPGLAITASAEPKPNPRQPDRYGLTHVGSGGSVISELCGLHVQQAADAVIALGLDWNIPTREAMVAAIETAGQRETIAALRKVCDSPWCTVGDGPLPLSASAGCDTCKWETDPTDDDWPLTDERAAELASAHDCEPQVWIGKIRSDGVIYL